MENAVGEVQNILVLGGRSEIGVAIARELLTPSTQRVTLACRKPDESREVEASLARNGLRVESVNFDAADTGSHGGFIDNVVAGSGDLDVVILAFGVLGSQEQCDDDAQSAVKIAHTNYTGAVSIAMEVAKRFRQQGHGHLIILSSVAGERTRKANYVYGSTKAGLDAFAQGLSDAMVGTGCGARVG